MEFTLKSFLKSLGEYVGRENTWMAEVFIIVLVTAIIAFIASRFLSRLMEKAANTKNLWDDALCESISKPLRWFIWVVGLSFAAEVAAEVSEVSVLASVGVVRRVATIFIVMWFFTSFISKAEKNISDGEYVHQPMDKTTALALGKLLRISVVITAILIALQALGYSISGVLAFGGIGGIAVGFAAKDLLANFFGGLMIYLDRPFSVGDWVRSPDKQIEGTVEEIGWRLTRIRTFDKRPLYVPNSTFTQISVENPSRMLNRRIYETIGIRYSDADKMHSIVAQVKAMLQEHPELDPHSTLIVNFNSFGPSALNFFIYCFTKTTDWIKYHEIKQDVMLKIISIIEAAEAECAFPTTTLHIPDGVKLQAENSDLSFPQK